MRLIDVDALGIGTAKREAFVVPECADGWNSAIEIINNAPTTTPDSLVKRGRWDKNAPDDNVVYCDQCMMPQDMPTKYCPSCGALMED